MCASYGYSCGDLDEALIILKLDMISNYKKVGFIAIVFFFAVIITISIVGYSHPLVSAKNQLPVDTPDTSLNTLQTLLLGNSKNLYFPIPNPGMDCGSGGCTHDAYFGSDLKTAKRVSGFDSYTLDCSTGKTTFIKDTTGEIFGFLKLDQEHSIVELYYHLSADQGTEDFYHIARDGKPTLIASYDNICSNTTQTLFRSKDYPPNMTAF